MVHLPFVLLLASSTCSFGVRLEISNVLASEGNHNIPVESQSRPLTCVLKASNYNQWKVSVSFPVKSQIDCADTRNNKPVEDDVFPRVFETTVDESDDSCRCSVNGQTRVTLEHYDTNECRTNSMIAREECWTSYKKLMSLKAEVTQGGLPHFAVQKPCLECVQKYCYSLPDMLLATVSMPVFTTKLSAQENKLLSSALGNWTKYDADLDDIARDLDQLESKMNQLDAEIEEALVGTTLASAATTLGNARLALGHGLPAAQFEESLATTLKSAEATLESARSVLQTKLPQTRGKSKATLTKADATVQNAERVLKSADKTLESARLALQRTSAIKPKLTVNTAVTSKLPSSSGPPRADKPFPVNARPSSSPRTNSGRPKTPVPLHSDEPDYAYRCCCATVNAQTYAVHVVLAENESQVGLAVGESGWSNGTEDSQACPVISSVKPIFTKATTDSICACTTEWMVFKAGNKCGGLFGTLDSDRFTMETHHVENDEWSDSERNQCLEGCKAPAAIVDKECID